MYIIYTQDHYHLNTYLRIPSSKNSTYNQNSTKTRGKNTLQRFLPSQTSSSSLQTFRVKLSSPPIPDIIRDCPLTSFREHGSRSKSRAFREPMKLPRRNSSGDEHTGLHTRSASPPPRINFFYVSRIAARTRSLLLLSLSLSGFRFPRKATSVDWTNFGSERAGTTYVSWQCLLPSSPGHLTRIL